VAVLEHGRFARGRALVPIFAWTRGRHHFVGRRGRSCGAGRDHRRIPRTGEVIAQRHGLRERPYRDVSFRRDPRARRALRSVDTK
jgi:hypothetical protein